jgi:hypothetical protein
VTVRAVCAMTESDTFDDILALTGDVGAAARDSLSAGVASRVSVMCVFTQSGEQQTSQGGVGTRRAVSYTIIR